MKIIEIPVTTLKIFCNEREKWGLDYNLLIVDNDRVCVEEEGNIKTSFN